MCVCVCVYLYIFEIVDALHVCTWCLCIYIKYIFLQTDPFMHAHAQTDKWSSTLTFAPPHTLELRCRRVWELTFPCYSCSIFQSASSLQQPTRNFCIPRIFGAVFAQVACVRESEVEWVCVLFLEHISQICFFTVQIGAELCLAIHEKMCLKMYMYNIPFHDIWYTCLCFCVSLCVCLCINTHTQTKKYQYNTCFLKCNVLLHLLLLHMKNACVK